MGKYIIAEYVESQALVDVLGLMGVDYAQGYGIAKPGPFGYDYRSGLASEVRDLRVCA